MCNSYRTFYELLVKHFLFSFIARFFLKKFSFYFAVKLKFWILQKQSVFSFSEFFILLLEIEDMHYNSIGCVIHGPKKIYL